MASKPRLIVGVMSLMRTDVGDLQGHGLFGEVLACAPYFDFTTLGHPYADSPDEWVPFGTQATIRQLIEQGLPGYAIDFVSSSLDRTDVRAKTGLYVIDPMALLHPKKRDCLRLIQQQLYVKPGPFCIVIPWSVPKTLREGLLDLCSVEFKDLESVGKVPAEMEVEKELRLKRFLSSVGDFLKIGADPAQLAVSTELFAALAAAVAAGLRTPALVGATA